MGTLFNESFTIQGVAPFTRIQRTIVVTSPTNAQLSFSDRGNDNSGGVIDNVVLSTSTTAVPEPSNLLGILAIGAIGVGTVLKRKQKNTAIKA